MKKMDKYCTALFEGLAQATWERIRFGEELNCSQGEETITDINLLDMKRAESRTVRVKKVNKAEEAKFGIDWEWWIGSNRHPTYRGWLRYAVQAKKLDKSGHYKSLRHKIGNQYQFDILENYAVVNRCIPLYCFYNYVADNTRKYWHCCSLPYDQSQMGCTIAPLDIVRPVFRKRASKKFEDIHKDERALPWRCLLCCPALLPQPGLKSHPLTSDTITEFLVHDELPSFLSDEQDREGLKFPARFYNNDLGIYPKRIVVIDFWLIGLRG